MSEEQIKCQYKANTCHLVICIAADMKTKEIGVAKNVENIRNCDIFIDDYDFYLYVDTKLYRFRGKRCFDVKELTTLAIQYDTKENAYKLQLRCLPPEVQHPPKPKTGRREFLQIAQYAKANYGNIDMREDVYKIDYSKLRRITDICRLQLDSGATVKFDNSFSYGFARKYSGKLPTTEEFDKDSVRIPDPQLVSPLQRSVERANEELTRFSRDEYKANFVELQVPEGHENPLKFRLKFSAFQTNLSQDQSLLLHNIAVRKQHTEGKVLPNNFKQSEIDCGLVSILLAICYDVRTTSNVPTCESGWTRCMLSPALCYFEVFDNYKNVLISFIRRVLTYPLYRSFELARACIQDAMEVLLYSRAWILKQLLITHQKFTEDGKYEIFNTLYIADYVRYLTNTTICSTDHLRVIGRNLKNVTPDVTKRHLDLRLTEIETELFKELISEMRIDENGFGLGHLARSVRGNRLLNVALERNDAENLIESVDGNPESGDIIVNEDDFDDDDLDDDIDVDDDDLIEDEIEGIDDINEINYVDDFMSGDNDTQQNSSEISDDDDVNALFNEPPIALDNLNESGFSSDPINIQNVYFMADINNAASPSTNAADHAAMTNMMAELQMDMHGTIDYPDDLNEDSVNNQVSIHLQDDDDDDDEDDDEEIDDENQDEDTSNTDSDDVDTSSSLSETEGNSVIEQISSDANTAK